MPTKIRDLCIIICMLMKDGLTGATSLPQDGGFFARKIIGVSRGLGFSVPHSQTPGIRKVRLTFVIGIPSVYLGL